ncbi:MAG: fasciclin domain-containing protein [Bacteroidota bacterium]
MKKQIVVLSILFLFFTALNTATAQCNSHSKAVKVGNTEMKADNNIVANFVESEDLTTLVAAVKAADLVGTLQGKGPFTVFAPNNDAFENLPDGTVSTLLEPQNKSALTKILTYHVVAGSYDAASIVQAIKKGNGKAVLTTVSGDQLTAMMNGERNVILMDEKGQYANVAIYDVPQSNGVVHIIDAVVLPN